MPISIADIKLGVHLFHQQHLASGLTPLDVLPETAGKLYTQMLMHDYLHYFFNLTVKEEDTLTLIETRLDAQCTSLSYMSEYTDRLPVGFQALWNEYCLS